MNGPTTSKGKKIPKLLSIEALVAEAVVLLIVFSVIAAELSTRHLRRFSAATAIFVILFAIWLAVYYDRRNRNGAN